MRPVLAALLAALLSACNCGSSPVMPGDNAPPSAAISSPSDGAELSGEGPFLLAGAGSDPEDGALAASALTWSSDVEGPLGTGASVNAALRPGAHRISLDVVDSGGLTARAQITVTVVTDGTGENQPPVVTISSPASGTMIDQGIALSLTGSAHDPEEGALAGMSLVWTADREGMLGTGSTATFQSTTLGTHVVVLTATDSKGLSAYASLTLEVVLAGANRPPVVSITRPSTGAQFQRFDLVTLEGSAVDPEDGALIEAALRWSSSRDGALGTGSPLTTSTLSEGVHTITLSASDSADLTGSASITVTIQTPANQSPTATITAPANAHTGFQGSPITFTGTGSDPEDGALSGASLTWSSSRDGALGTGASLTVSTLSVGAHTITLTARDSAASEGVATIAVTILAPNAAPTVNITSPANNSSYTAGSQVALRGTASDPEDGALSGMSLTWRSDLDGVLGTGGSVDTSSLGVGAHQLTLTAIDSGGRSASASVAITIQPMPGMLPPIARLSGPTRASPGQTLAFDGSTSSDSDGTIVEYRFTFSDGSPERLGTSTRATHAFASAATYTVTLRVKDDHGLTSTANLTVVVSTDVRVPFVAEQGIEQLGTMCRLEAQSDAVQVAFRDNTHARLRYGVLNGTSWSSELVDGPGFEVGGLVETRISLAVEPNGVPHLAYSLEGKGLWYATKSGGTWTRERVDSSFSLAAAYPQVSIGLDPSRANRPTIAYQNYLSTYRVAVAARTGPGTWTNTRVTLGSATHQYLKGDLAISPTGTVYVPHDHSLGTWDGSTTETLNLGAALPTWTNLGWLAPGHLGLLSGAGLLDVTLAAPLASSTIVSSSVESFNTAQQALATDASGLPRILVNHGAELELITVDTAGYWTRTSLGATDAADVDLAVDSQGRTRACFFRSGKLILY